MRVLIHSDEYYPTAQACAYRMQVIADTFVSLGDEVTVITSSANKTSGKIDKNSHNERIIYSSSIRMKKKTTIMRMLNNLSFGFSSLFSAIRVGKVDVVITTSPPPLISISGWLIARCKRAKLVYDVRDIWPDVALEMGSFSEKSFFCKVFRRIVKFMYKHSDIITTVSPGKVEKIKSHVGSLKGKKAGQSNIEKVWLVGNGFDETISCSTFDQTIVDKYEMDRHFTCVYIGNIGLAQGLESLLDVAAKTKHKNVQFLCFGKGAKKEELEKRVLDDKLDNVKFCGVLEHSKVYSILSAAKLSFIPLKSSNMKDSVPTKIYEALGIGCPVLLLAEGDSVSIVKESGLGMCVSPDNVENLVDVFDNMIDNFSSFEQKQEKAISLMKEKYSRQKIAKEFNIKLKEYCK